MAETLRESLARGFDLARAASPEPHTYRVETRIATYSVEGGAQTGTERYSLELACVPGSGPEDQRGSCTCAEFSFERGDAGAVEIPALVGWSYPFSLDERWYDGEGNAYGLVPRRFEGLVDSRGEALPPEVVYQVYSVFVYFHDFTHGLTSQVGSGDLALHRIGQGTIVEPSETSLEFGSTFGEGSVFKGEKMLIELRGVGLVDDAPCAILAFRSGGWFTALMTPAPNVDIKTVGRSRFSGEVFLDLASGWPTRVAMDLTDVTRTTMGEQVLARAVLETTLDVAVVSRAGTPRAQ